MSLKVNYTYSILTDNVVPAESVWFRGSSGCPPRNRIQEKALTLLFQGKTAEEVGCCADFLIRLLRCSEYWPNYAKTYDPLNTYDNDLYTGLDKVPTGFTYEELRSWLENADIPLSSDYRASSSFIEKLISAIYSILTAKDGTY